MAYRRLFTGTLLSTGLITIHHTCLFKTVRMGCVLATVAECGEVSLSRAGYCCLDKVSHHHWYVNTVPIMHHTEYMPTRDDGPYRNGAYRCYQSVRLFTGTQTQ